MVCDEASTTLRPVFDFGVAVVLIANEEASSITGIGVDRLAEVWPQSCTHRRTDTQMHAHALTHTRTQEGELDFITPGQLPVYWLDVANVGPVLGSGRLHVCEKEGETAPSHARACTPHPGGIVLWELTAHGKKGHSGFPLSTINPISMGAAAVTYVQVCKLLRRSSGVCHESTALLTVFSHTRGGSMRTSPRPSSAKNTSARASKIGNLC